MIRINLLGQTRPRAARRPVDTGAALPLVFVGAGAALGVRALFLLYLSWQKQLNDENTRISNCKPRKLTWNRSSSKWTLLRPRRRF
jgi:hypothetical protein